MTPYYERDGITIYHGDLLAILPAIGRNKIDILLADPPYSSGGSFRGDRLQDVHSKYVQSDSVSGWALNGFTGDNRDQRGYWFWMALWLGSYMEAIKAGGLVALFCDWRQLPITTDSLQAGGYVWRGIVPWYKPNGRPTQGRWGNQCEYVVWGTNGPRELAGTAFPGFYQASPPTNREHIAQKPLSVIKEMLAIVPKGGVVLDPFMGSGTTLRAAKDLGLKAIGIEIEEHYCESAARRLEQEVMTLEVPA